MRNIYLRVALLVTGIASACNGEGSEKSTSSVTSRDAEEWTVSDSAILRIGAVSGSLDQTFHSVVYAGLLSDGRVVVADGGSRTVRWFSPTGNLERQAGGRGGGPGEFEQISDALLLRGDTLVVYDSRHRRATWFGPGGTVVREQPMRGSGEIKLIGADENNAIMYVEAHFSPDVSHPDYSYAQAAMSIKVTSAGGQDVIAERPGPDAVFWVRYNNGRPTATLRMSAPFAHEAPVAVARSHIAVSVDGGRSIEVLDSNGKRLDYITLDGWRGSLVSSDDRERYVRAAFKDAQQRGRRDPEGARVDAEERIATLPPDHHVPAFDRILAADYAHFWIRDYMAPWQSGESSIWRVVDPTKGAIGVVHLPKGLRVMQVTDNFITGLERDSLGVESVAVYVLQR